MSYKSIFPVLSYILVEFTTCLSRKEWKSGIFKRDIQKITVPTTKIKIPRIRNIKFLYLFITPDLCLIKPIITEKYLFSNRLSKTCSTCYNASLWEKFPMK